MLSKFKNYQKSFQVKSSHLSSGNKAKICLYPENISTRIYKTVLCAKVSYRIESLHYDTICLDDSSYFRKRYSSKRVWLNNTNTTLNFLDDYVTDQASMRAGFVRYAYASQNNFTQVLRDMEREQNILKPYSNSFYRCNPRIHIENETFVQFTKIDQAYIINEANINGKTCIGGCADRKTGSKVTCSYDQEHFGCDWNTRCTDFYDCGLWYTFAHVCYSPNQAPNRRYDHIFLTSHG